ncbi:MAG: RluA family pseudouridine synthase [Lachnospiraceae bacterium]|nr:RluA family pseudouridine synthase [Lachnospiraceae bacterium]
MGKEAEAWARVLEYSIPEKDAGLRVEQYLRRKGYSRQNLTELKKFPDTVLADGRSVHMSEKLKAGERLTVRIQEEHLPQSILPVRLPLSIVYEDEDILVVNKPAGMPTHPSMNNHTNSLASAVTWYYKEKGVPFTFRCGNRLDRDTSGLTVIAKHMLAAAILSELTAEHRMEREYYAIVRGRVTPPFGTIDAPLGRKPGSVIERTVDYEHGERAVTHYRVVGEANGHSLVSLLLETGRTHQIRIHLKHLGFPLIGDYLYNPDMEFMERQALHARRLSFPHPITGERMEFTAGLPEDMRRVIGVEDDFDMERKRY